MVSDDSISDYLMGIQPLRILECHSDFELPPRFRRDEGWGEFLRDIRDGYSSRSLIVEPNLTLLLKTLMYLFLHLSIF